MSNLTPLQEIKLQFKQLTELPVPTSQNEILCCKEPDGKVYCFQSLRNVGAGKFVFICDVEPDCTYAHVKVTAAETEFKVGDIVKNNNIDEKFTITEIDSKSGIVTLDNKGFSSEHMIICYHLTDLTLITNE